MALIIRAGDIDESRERRFFARHIHPWAEKFFKALQAAQGAGATTSAAPDGAETSTT